MSPTIGLHATKVKHFFFHNINWSITSFLSVWNSSIKDSVSLNSALIGQMTQSVVIGLLCSDWSDGPVCFDWSTLLWLDRWSSLLWLVGLLCSDWTDDPFWWMRPNYSCILQFTISSIIHHMKDNIWKSTIGALSNIM